MWPVRFCLLLKALLFRHPDHSFVISYSNVHLVGGMASEDIATAAPQLQHLSISAKETEGLSQAPRSNLPLPTELQLQIYGYLLSHEHVHGIPWKDRTPARGGAVCFALFWYIQ